MKYKFVAIPEVLREYVEAIIVGEHDGETNLTTKGYLNALPGIVFQHHNGRSPIDSITTSPAIVPIYRPCLSTDK